MSVSVASGGNCLGVPMDILGAFGRTCTEVGSSGTVGGAVS
jgi:ABC-type tungstate transport system substrate-binding protein